MPFERIESVDGRRLLAHQVLEQGLSLSEACRRAGVTRKTGRKWVERARLLGIENLVELSRAPRTSPDKTAPEVEAALLALRETFPYWGAKKLVKLLKSEQGISLPLRTAGHILRRRGLTRPSPKAPEPQRFERESCGALLQMDFKGLPRGLPYSLLSVLDDHARFCLHFSPVPDKTALSVQRALWELFGEHGLPSEMLMDNGDCWGAPSSRCPTRFECWLMRLGVRPIHGRPHHPQTQGKVERFHKTALHEMGKAFAQQDIARARAACAEFVQRYNWRRPHESLGQETPGSFYKAFERKRPDKPPEHYIPEGAVSRKVDQEGDISYGKLYKVGKGLSGERVLIVEGELGERLSYAGFDLPYLFELDPREKTRRSIDEK